MSSQQRVNGFEPRQSQKRIAQTQNHMAQLAHIQPKYVNGQRIITVVTPSHEELYAGTDWDTAGKIVKAHNDAISVQAQ